LVPAYDIPRLDLLAGNDKHIKPELVQIATGSSGRDLYCRQTIHCSPQERWAVQRHAALGHRITREKAAETAAD